MSFIPPHKLVETYWVELTDEKEQVQWSFEEAVVKLMPPGEREQVGTWVVSGDELTIRLPGTNGTVLYAGKFTDDLVAPRKVLTLDSVDLKTTKRLYYSGKAYYPETGRFSREWYYYWNRFVPDTGQASTLQGEILRITFRMAAMYGNSGGGNWMEAPETYDAFADVTVNILCDGTFDKQTTDFIAKTVRNLQQFCHNGDENSAGPEYSDVDQLSDFALEWCKQHPEPIPRQHDNRMAF